MNSSTPFILVTGFLGSGKTTFVKRFLRIQDKTTNMAVIQNEFAPSNVDGEELMQSTNRDFELLEINNGSVFCVCLLGTFVHALSEFMEVHHPDVILMEASGLSDPAGIAELFQAPELKDKVYFKEAWCIVDAAHFEKIEKMNTRYRHQVQVADRVIVNKVDRVSTEVVDNVVSRIRELNPYCSVVESAYCEVDTEMMKAALPDTIPGLNERIDAEESEGRPVIQSGVLKIAAKVSIDAMIEIFSDLNNELIRMKGFFCDREGQGYAIHLIHGDLRWERLEDYTGNVHLILMGTKINIREMSRIIKKAALK